MPIIIEKNEYNPKKFNCSDCKEDIETTHYWLVDDESVCDNCHEDIYSELVKCKSEDCCEYGEKDDFRKGICESCEEINTPLNPEEQEGWEHTIRKWNAE